MRGERERVADRVRELLGTARADTSAGHRYRWAPDRRSVASVGVVVLVVAAVTAWWVSSSHPTSVPVTGPPGSVASLGPVPSASVSGSPGGGVTSTAAPSGATTGSAATIVVDVAGKVVRPGIYHLPADARVYDAVRAAGGARAGVDTVALNLAAPLQDGEQVVVGVSGAPAGPVVMQSGAVTTGPSMVDLNTASLENLETLPGVGPVLAQRILDWRSEHGRFDTIDQLNEVSGIGDVTFANLRDLVSV